MFCSAKFNSAMLRHNIYNATYQFTLHQTVRYIRHHHERISPSINRGLLLADWSQIPHVPPLDYGFALHQLVQIWFFCGVFGPSSKSHGLARTTTMDICICIYVYIYGVDFDLMEKIKTRTISFSVCMKTFNHLIINICLRLYIQANHS